MAVRKKRFRPHSGFIGLSLSCDGVHWSPLVVLSTCHSSANRTWDQPVDGFVVVNKTVFALLHKNVQGIAPPSADARLQPIGLEASTLEALTHIAQESLPGCEGGPPGVALGDAALAAAATAEVGRLHDRLAELQSEVSLLRAGKQREAPPPPNATSLSHALPPPPAPPNAASAPCCEAAEPEAGRAGRCKFLAEKHKTAGRRCPGGVRHFCPVACRACAICAGHPQRAVYDHLYRQGTLDGYAPRAEDKS